MSRKIKVGIFLVGGIALFCVGLFLIGTREHLFGQYFTVYTHFTDINTLETGAKVRVSGMDAGQITEIDVPKQPSGQFRLKLKVEKNFRPMIREDSVASIETEGMVGNKFVNIKKGSAHSPECPSGCTLQSQEPVSMDALMRQGNSLANTMQSTIQDIQHRADGAIQNITSLTGNADKLVAGVSPNVTRITSNADAIVAGIRQGHGAAGKLLADRRVASNVDDTIANAKQTSANLTQASGKANTIISDVQRTDLAEMHKTLRNTQDMTQQLNQAVGSFLSAGNSNENTAEALRDAAHGAQQTTTNLADDTEAFKHNFFLRGFFHRRGFFDLENINPSAYIHSEFVKKPRARVWVPSSGLFNVRPDGSQELSDTGRSILDQSMSELVRYLPNNPLVIEAYSSPGMPEQQYLASRQRAIQVREYLESHFYLNANQVGIMPFGDHPPKGVGKQSWDGVCLVLVVSRH